VPPFLLPLLQNPLTLPRLRNLERKIHIPNGNTQRLLHSLIGQMRHEAAIDEGFLAVLGARGGGAELGDESAAPAETGAGNGEGGGGAEGGEEGEDAGPHQNDKPHTRTTHTIHKPYQQKPSPPPPPPPRIPIRQTLRIHQLPPKRIRDHDDDSQGVGSAM
jgi:hypothetical protein